MVVELTLGRRYGLMFALLSPCWLETNFHLCTPKMRMLRAAFVVVVVVVVQQEVGLVAPKSPRELFVMRVARRRTHSVDFD